MIQTDTFEDIIGFRFANPDLLKQALTHRSFVNETEVEDVVDNERMEFLGDAVLDFVVADMLYRRYPDMPEGELTRLRSALVRTESLAMLGIECHIGEFLLMGKGEERSGGRGRINNLCRGFEALIGGIYLDAGLEAVRSFVIPRLESLLEYILENDLHRDARTDLQEWSQAELSITPKYRLVGEAGPEHQKEFMVEVVVNDKIIGQGIGSSKRLAAQSAARAALKRLETEGWPE